MAHHRVRRGAAAELVAEPRQVVHPQALGNDGGGDGVLYLMAGHPIDVLPAQPGILDGGHDRPQRQREGAHPRVLG